MLSNILAFFGINGGYCRIGHVPGILPLHWITWKMTEIPNIGKSMNFKLMFDRRRRSRSRCTSAWSIQRSFILISIKGDSWFRNSWLSSRLWATVTNEMSNVVCIEFQCKVSMERNSSLGVPSWDFPITHTRPLHFQSILCWQDQEKR